MKWFIRSTIWSWTFINLLSWVTTLNCSELRVGQYYCDDVEIDLNTQQAARCTPEGQVSVCCHPVSGVVCNRDSTTDLQCEFNQTVPCVWTNGYHYQTALLFSVFGGLFGMDRFYLGYIGLGTLKLFTCGFMCLGYLADIILIATQYIGPADGSAYIVDYYGPRFQRVVCDEDTYVRADF